MKLDKCLIYLAPVLFCSAVSSKPNRLDSFVQRADQNYDGALSRKEFNDYANAAFQQWWGRSHFKGNRLTSKRREFAAFVFRKGDKNGDGLMTAEELSADGNARKMANSLQSITALLRDRFKAPTKRPKKKATTATTKATPSPTATVAATTSQAIQSTKADSGEEKETESHEKAKGHKVETTEDDADHNSNAEKSAEKGQEGDGTKESPKNNANGQAPTKEKNSDEDAKSEEKEDNKKEQDKKSESGEKARNDSDEGKHEGDCGRHRKGKRLGFGKRVGCWWEKWRHGKGKAKNTKGDQHGQEDQTTTAAPSTTTSTILNTPPSWY